MSSRVHGADALQSGLSDLRQSGVGRVAKSMVNAAAGVQVRAEKAGAPRGATKQTAGSIGKRVKLDARAAVVTAKTGINVGKRKAAAAGYKPHAHLVAAGTVKRYRKRIGGRFRWLLRPTSDQLSTGAMPANNWIGNAISASKPAAAIAARTAGAKALDREAAKIAKRVG